MKYVVLGAGTAGTAFARKMRFYDKKCEIILIDKFGKNQYSPCALPYFIEGIIKNVEVYNSYETENIIYLRGYEAVKIENKHLICKNNIKTEKIYFDKLIVAAGSEPIVPNIKNLKNYFILKTKDDAIKLKNIGGSVAIIGGGYIGLETAFSLAKKHKVTIYEKNKNLLENYLDEDFSHKIKEYLIKKGINIITESNMLCVEDIKEQNIVICTGFNPNKSLLKKLGVSEDTNDFFESKKNKDVYLIGDILKIKNIVSKKYEYPMLGSLAQKQGEFLAKNLFLKTNEKYEGFVLNAITKLGDLIIGTVGITKKTASNLNMKSYISKFSNLNKYKSCGGQEINVKLLFDEKGKILGCQIIGFEDVSGRLNMISSFIKNNLTVRHLVKTDTCYNPCSANIQDSLVEAAKIAIKKLEVIKSDI